MSKAHESNDRAAQQSAAIIVTALADGKPASTAAQWKRSANDVQDQID